MGVGWGEGMLSAEEAALHAHLRATGGWSVLSKWVVCGGLVVAWGHVRAENLTAHCHAKPHLISRENVVRYAGYDPRLSGGREGG